MSATTKSDSDSEYEEEEVLVYCDLKNVLFHNSNVNDMSIKVIGVETLHPVIEVNEVVIEGKYDFSIGTNVFFEVNDTPATTDPIFSTSATKTYKYFDKTNKIIGVHRILTEKDNEDERLTARMEAPVSENLSYKDALNLISEIEPQLPTTTRLNILKESNKPNESNESMESSEWNESNESNESNGSMEGYSSDEDD